MAASLGPGRVHQVCSNSSTARSRSDERHPDRACHHRPGRIKHRDRRLSPSRLVTAAGRVAETPHQAALQRDFVCPAPTRAGQVDRDGSLLLAR